MPVEPTLPLDDLEALPPPAPARQRMGRYELVEELARGGMGVVYVAWDPQLQRQVALKVLPGGVLHAGPLGVERFLREAQAVASLDHPGIVRVFDIGESDGCVFFAMDLVAGGTLADQMARRGAYPAAEAATLLARVARALAAAHACGIVHRDIKPGNILLEPDGAPRITDFGLAARVDDQDHRLTRAGQVLGTPLYMAPEQASGRLGEHTPATDVYALGVIGFELLTGQPPFDERGVSLVLKKPDLDARSPRGLAPQTPADLDTIVTKAMAREPRDRYANAAALAEDLERYLRGEPILARAPSLYTQVRWSVRRHRQVLPLVAGLAAALAGTVAVTWVATAESREQRAREAAAQDLATRMEAQVALLRSQGREVAAQEIFDVMARDRVMQQTETLARAWVHEADQRSDPEARRVAHTQALQMTGDPELEARLLVGMGRDFQRQARLKSVLAVARALETLSPAAQDRPAVAELQAWVQTALFHPAEAEAAWLAVEGADGPRLRATRALANATRLPGDCHQACRVWDPDGDGAPDFAWWSQDATYAWVPLAAPGRSPVSANSGGLPVQRGAKGLDSALVVTVDGAPAVLRPTVSPTPEPVRDAQGHRLEWSPRELPALDLDGDGTAERYIGADRQLWRLEPAAGGWTAVAPIPALGFANSEVTDLLHLDLDGDGQRELVLSLAEWGAFDVRVYDEQLALRSRLRLGDVQALAPLPGGDTPSFAAVVGRHYSGDLELYAGDAHFEGLVLLGLDETGQLQVLEQLALPTAGLERLYAGDVDGDGDTDLLYSVDGNVGVWLLGADSVDLPPLMLAGQDLLGVVELDGDPAVELVLSDRSTRTAWIAGIGEDSAPITPPEQPTPLPVPDLDDPWDEASWRSAEALVAMGLPSEAAGQLRGRARLARGTALGSGMLARAAELYVQNRDWTGLWTTARDLGPDDLTLPADRQAVQAALRRAALLEEEYAVLQTMDRDAELEARRKSLEAALTADGLALRFDGELPAGLRVVAPELVEHDRVAGELRMGIGAGPLLEVPIELGDGPLLVELDLGLDRVDWAGDLRVSLKPLDGPPTDALEVMWVQVRGGRGREFLGGGLRGAWLPWGFSAGPPPYSWDGRIEGRIDPETGTSMMRASSGKVGVQSVSLDPEPAPPAGRYLLTLGSASEYCIGGRFVLRGLRLRGEGVRLAPAVDDPVAIAARQVLEGWPEHALTTLGDLDGTEADRTRLAAYDALGEEAAAERVFARLVATPWVDRVLPTLLRSAPERTVARTQHRLPETWVQRTSAAWACVADPDLRDRDELEVFARSLPQLGDVDPEALDTDEARLDLASALVTQAVGWSGLRQSPRARRTLDRAQAALDVLDAPDRPEARQARATLLVERAALLAVEQGRTDAGRQQVLDALDTALLASLSPELLLDRLLLDARFAPVQAALGERRPRPDLGPAP